MRRLLGVLLAVAMVAGACGSDGEDEVIEDVIEDASSGADAGSDGTEDDDETDSEGSGASAATIDVKTCEVVTANDLASQGFVVEGEPTLSEDPSFEQCIYAGASGAGSVYVNYAPPSSGQGAVGDAEEIDGLAEGAIYNESGGLITVTLADGGLLTIQTFADVGNLRDFLVGLAETAVSRI